tara:strand:- start:5661 stop:6548 length:888 start_codon:yes stop_codon:yes gene_type:complete
MNLEWYRTFKYIYELNSLTEAAQKLYMTQPGVSKQLAALEAYVDQKLFERKAKKVLPTEYGKFLYTQVVGHLEALESAERKFKKGSNKKCPSIVIGCSYDTFKRFFLNEVGKIDMYITFQFGNEKELVDLLEKEKIHLLLTEQDYQGYDHSIQKSASNELILVGSPDLEPPYDEINKATEQEITQWLFKQTWYAYDNKLKYVNEYWQENFHSRPHIMAKYVFPSATDIVTALSHETGLAVLPRFVCQEALNQQQLSCLLTNAIHPEWHLYWAYKNNTKFLYEIGVFQNHFTTLLP